MNCQYCQGDCVKNGRQSNGQQRFRCKTCCKSQQATYHYKACQKPIRDLFLKCLKAGNSLRGITFITGISVNTQIRWIRKLGKVLKPPSAIRLYDEYELDELCTYVGNKNRRRWVISAISRSTGKVVAIKTGTRTAQSLKVVVDKLLCLSPIAIHTDRLIAYRSLIPPEIHKIKAHGINKIERYHLNLRTHIKRLNRRTICFAKRIDMLNHLVRLHAWN
ncbi:MAG: IS1 family transposase [Roseivirga sp.]|nr:IS1 family transposase [Roseivirga sp.]